jgi:hypothetical protein
MILQIPSDHKSKWFAATPLLLSLLLAVFNTGCATNPDNRLVGKLTYDRAVSQFGQPIKADKDSNGETHAKWLAYEWEFTVTGMPNGFFSINTDQQSFHKLSLAQKSKILWVFSDNSNIMPTPFGATRKGKYLGLRVLTFGSDDILRKAEEGYELKWQDWINAPTKKP